MIIHNRDRERHLDYNRIMSQKSVSVREERIRTYTHMPGNPDRDARIRLALNRGLDKDKPVCI